MTSVSTLRSTLRRRDPLEVAAGAAALSLLPQNSGHLDQLHALALEALTKEPFRTDPVGDTEWRDLVIGAPSLHEGLPWDPPDGPLTVPLTAPGGTYVVATGGEAEAGTDLQLVADALCLASWPASADPVRGPFGEFLIAGLRLMDHICAGADLGRFAPVERSSQPVVPPGDEVRRPVAGLIFTPSELEAITRYPLAVLEPLIHDLDQRPLSGAHGMAGTSALSLTPLARSRDRIVAADPLALPVAVRHHAILGMLAGGLRDELAQALTLATLNRVQRAVNLMRWTEMEELPSNGGATLRSFLYAMDQDKVAHVIVYCDDLNNYSEGDPRGMWDARTNESDIRNQILGAEWAILMGPPPRPNGIFHLLVVGNIGRSAMFPMPRALEPVEAPIETFTVDSLITVSMLGLDRLDLYKFAQAHRALEQRVHVAPVNPIDTFGLWWGDEQKPSHQSFYLDDDARPTTLIIASDYGLSLREKAAEHDVHGAFTHTETVTDVVRLYGDPVPIYAPLHDLGRGAPRQLVEGASVPIWVVGLPNGAAQAPARRIVDAVSYWLWQLTPALPDLSVIGSVLTIEVEIDSPEDWRVSTDADGSTSSGSGPPEVVAEARVADGDVVVLKVYPTIVAKLNAANNLAERELIAVVLEALDDLVEACGGTPAGATERERALNEFAPLGPKKKINVFGGGITPLLVGDGLAAGRMISEHDISEVLGLLGESITGIYGSRPRELVGDERTHVLHSGVEVLFAELERVVATLSSEGLLEALVARHEALLHDTELERRTLGAQLACFGDELADQYRQRIPEGARTSLSVRFLIEYVAARPPQGLRPFSDGIYDRLMALALEIANLGMSSDVIQFELEDSELTILGSGRLGFDHQGAYALGQQAFTDVAAPAQARSAAESFARTWQASGNENDGGDDSRLDRAALDAAAQAEWGFSMDEIGGFLGALTKVGFELGPGVASGTRRGLVGKLGGELDWPSDRVEQAIDLFSLGPRAEFMSPDAPFKRIDVYPWRYNRALSYLRRPLLVRQAGTGEEIVWGPRHADVAGRHLLNLILSERLKAHSQEMKALMTEMRQHESEDFNDAVAELFEQAGYEVIPRFDGAGGQKIRRDNGQDLGDIDVLAADNDNRALIAVECKHLEGARTPAELFNEIDKTFGTGGRRRSAVEKHIERADWLEAHKAEALKALGLDGEASDWSVAARVVVDVEVMAPYVISCSLPVTPLRALKEELLERENPRAGADS